VKDYVSSHFIAEEREAQTKIINKKIAFLRLKEIQKCDEIVKRSKNPRLLTNHDAINDPEAYNAAVLRSMMGKPKFKNLAYPLLDVLEKLSPDGIVFTDVFKRDFESIN